MTIGDLAHLGSPRGAQRDPAPQIARGRVVRAPASVNDSMVVALDRYALAFPYEVLSGRWPAGGRLPQSGDVCLVIFDDAGDAWVRGGAWQAETLLAVDGSGVSSALQLPTPQRLQIDGGTANMPFAGTSGPVTVVVNHGLGRVPTRVTATYDDYAGSAGLFVYAQARDTTTLTFRGVATAAVAGNVGFDWNAIG